MRMTHFGFHSVRATLKNGQERIKSNYLHKKGMKTKEIRDDMNKTFGEDCPCYSKVKKWVADFNRGMENTDDDARTGPH